MSSTGGWPPTVKLPTGPAAQEPGTGEVNGGGVVGVPADPANAHVVTVLAFAIGQSLARSRYRE
jgi:hypothetical protein